MDTRYTAEQAELRGAARRLARELGPSTVAGLDDATRRKRLAGAVRDAGWLELRDDAGDAAPLASGVEACIVAEALGAAVADVAFSGPVLAGDLARRAAAEPRRGAVVACDESLLDIASVRGAVTSRVAFAVDGDAETDTAYVVVPDGGGFRLAAARVTTTSQSADLTRSVCRLDPAATVESTAAARLLSHDDLVRWRALGLALTSADLVGVMRGVLDVTVAYAAERRQYGVPIGSFQAVQHLLAEAHTLLEGSFSVALHASWAVDSLEPAAAVRAGRAAKAYCARAARTVCETAIQVHGGIGNTWEHVAHVYLRRALLSAQWFGDDGEQLARLADERLGAA